MESRFSKLIQTRRVRTRASKLDLQTIPPPVTTSSIHVPTFLHQSLRQSRGETRKSGGDPSLRTVAYDETVPGKPPLIGGRPHKGNGPVKLQTSRRLSSGELLVTNQDYQRTLDEIRDGDYVVAGIPGRTSRLSQIRSQSSLAVHPIPPQKVVSSAPNTPRGITGVVNPSFTTLPRTDETIESPASVSAALSDSYLPSSSSLTEGSMVDNPRPVSLSYQHNPKGLGITTHSQTAIIDSSSTSRSLLEPHEEQNATIHALWRAEYARLVTMYGQAGVDRNIAELNRDLMPTSPDDGVSSNTEPLPSVLHDTLHLPVLNAKYSPNVKRSSDAFQVDASHRDDYSDGSSQKRLSLLSSNGAASSFTTRTSLGDVEQTTTTITTTREDVRKVVEDMRSNYLRAIESQSTSTMRSPKRKISQRSPVLSSSSPGSVVEYLADQQIRRSSTNPPSVAGQNGRSITPVPNNTQRLPSIEASPPKRDDEVDIGLKRADSTTLGSFLASTKRTNIAKRRTSKIRTGSKRSSKRSSSTRTTLPIQTHRPSISKSEQEAILATTASELKDFEDLCRDLFKASTDDPIVSNTTFWRNSSSSSSPSPSRTPSILDKPLPPPPVINHRTSFLDLSGPLAPPPTTSLPTVPSA